MDLNLNKEEHQKIGMYLNQILRDAQSLTAENIANKASSIVLHSEGIKNLLNKPKYKCYTCNDTSLIENPLFNRIVSDTGLVEWIPCPICNK